MSSDCNNNSHFQTTGVPYPPTNFKEPLRNYPKILQAIRLVANYPEDGVVVISGGPGSGKTATLAHLLTAETFHLYFTEECCLTSAFWLNCMGMKTGTRLKAILQENLQQPSNSKTLVILDDVYSVDIVPALRDFYPPLPCIVLTRDPVPLMAMATPCLVRDLGVYWLEPFVEDEIAEIIAGHDAELTVISDELRNAAKQCCGSPLVASLMAANHDFFSETRIVDLPVIFPTSNFAVQQKEETIMELYNFSLNMLENDQLLCRLYAFLLFEPGDLIPLIDLQILWQLENNYKEAASTCLNLERRSIINRYRYMNVFYVDAIFYETIAESARKWFADKRKMPLFSLSGTELLVAVKLGLMPGLRAVESGIETRAVLAISTHAELLKRDALLSKLNRHPSLSEFLLEVEKENQEQDVFSL